MHYDGMINDVGLIKQKKKNTKQIVTTKKKDDFAWSVDSNISSVRSTYHVFLIKFF